ncbi:HAMP domain-containing histidine kinase [Desulfoscipio geothermicus]|uniref:Histidine kinase-, DNA gyrase B-, and HSP90-like ATPase n=1 Tax=Desulfoscipio geothermicus DSM 3669 TaxID=1121426 RepID=A0A1I6E400_9FIRM|nr:HAMP domain-containing histidine kinase [Desulfoscipio geothermicus]SFR12504.1 hypothetical protein SAMN05660706_12540 [Desulfoscipio geothermicus DSM 3669]
MSLTINVLEWDHTELRYLVEQFSPHFRNPSQRKGLVLDFSNLSFAKPHVLLMVGCFANYLEALGVINEKDYYYIPPNKKDVHNYMCRIDFYKMVGINEPEEFTRWDGSGRFVEVCQTNRKNTFEVVNKIIDVLNTQFTDIDQTVLWGIDWSLNEVLDNIIIHAHSIIGGYVMVQNYYDRVDIAICDCGVGIASNIHSKWEKLSYTEALEHAIKKGVTTNKEGAGAGLYYASKIIMANNGIMSIYSGPAQLIIENGNISSVETPYFQGTMVYLSYNKKHSINHNDIWEESIPVTIDNYISEEEDLW